MKHKYFVQSKQRRTNKNVSVELREKGGVIMGVIAVSSMLVGAWANRCNVFILVPLIAATLVTAALYGIAHGDGAGGIAFDIATAVACLEAGYVAALLAPAFGMRTPQRAASGRGRLTAVTDPVPLAPAYGGALGVGVTPPEPGGVER